MRTVVTVAFGIGLVKSARRPPIPRMNLPIQPPFPTAEALNVEAIPEGDVWQYEPKWDGFRCLTFRDGDDVFMQSKSEKPLARYFPEVCEAIKAISAERFVIDGEIVIPIGDELSFEELLQRIHPAASRVKKLAQEIPATLIVFDLLVDEHGELLTGLPFEERRIRLEGFAAKHFPERGILLSPMSRAVDDATSWLNAVRGGLDGIIAKRLDLPYQSGERKGMQKVKKLRTADCVIGGFRYASKGGVVGSLLLGLYDNGVLHHVGFTSGFKNLDKDALTKQLESLKNGSGFSGRSPGGPSRWSTERSGDWYPLKPELVVEVQYDYFNEGRFRHGTRFLRWRPDKAAEQCTMDQVTRHGRPSLKLFE